MKRDPLGIAFDDPHDRRLAACAGSAAVCDRGRITGDVAGPIAFLGGAGAIRISGAACPERRA